MGCASCGEQPKKSCSKCNDFTKAVIEINNPESLVLLRKVVIPASLGDDTDVPAAVGKYRNVVLYYEANKHTYIYSSDGIPTLLEASIPPEILERISDLEEEMETKQEKITTEHPLDADLVSDTSSTHKFVTAQDLEDISTALQPQDIDKVVMTDLSINANTSTTTVQLDAAKENLMSGAQTTKNIPLPVASHDEAGIMNSSTFDAVTANTSNINALMNGAVAISGLSATPSQSDLTTAWEAETGLTSLMNRAGIYDVTNNKVWTYYLNTSTWYESSNTSQVTVNTFTNSSEGIIKGSTNTGQVFAENDGTGSVNGWDALTGDVASLQSNKQDKLTAGTNITISGNVISATGGGETYTAGNAITIDQNDNNRIDAAVYPEDFFTSPDQTEVMSGTSFTTEGMFDGPAFYRLLGNTTQDDEPTPDSPVTINTVTGVQTITVSDGTNTDTYTIDLGSIELCKIGDYQDYIYKSGDDWYVHKEIGKVIYDGSETWLYQSTSVYPFRIDVSGAVAFTISDDTPPELFTNYYTPVSWNDSQRPNYCVSSTTNSIRLCFRNTDITSLANWKTWLGSNNTIVYYPLATPTDTKITDQTLIADLNALYALQVVSEGMTFSTSATGTNLPVVLELTAIKKDLVGLISLIYYLLTVIPPEIVMQTYDPGEGEPVADNHFTAVYGSGPAALDYYTTEKDSGGTWVNGKIIYKKTISVGPLPNATTKNVAHGISNLSRVIKIEGFAYNSTTQATMPLPFPGSSSASATVAVTVAGSEISIAAGTDRSAFTEGYVTLYYTKSS